MKMETLTENKGLRVKEQRTELISTYQGKNLTFLHPAYGPDTYINVGNQIETNGLVKPNMAQTASLVHSAFNSDDKYSKEVRDIMKSRWLWGFTRLRYEPNKGAFVYDENDHQKFSKLSVNELEQILSSSSEQFGVRYGEDGSLRFVPFGFKTGEMSSLELSKNAYVIALVGEEGAEKLAEVADKHTRKPYLYSFKSVKEPIIKVSALYSDWRGGRLDVDGDYPVDANGFAFGLLRENLEQDVQQ